MTALLIAVGLGCPPVLANLLTARVLAQIAPGLITGELNQNSQVLNDGSYYNAYTFEGVTGETVIIEMSSHAFDTYLILLDSGGNLIVENDDGGGSTNSRIVLTLPSNGAYRIYANSYDAGATGQYSLSLQSSSGNPLQPVAAQFSAPPAPRFNTLSPNSAGSPQQVEQVTSQSITGRLDENSQTLNDGSYYNIHTFEGIVGQEITIDLISREFDAYLIFLEPGGNEIARNDDHGIIPGSTASRIITRLPETGTYQIIANSHRAGETGSYILSWQSSESAPCIPVFQEPESKSLSDLNNSKNTLEVAQLTPELIEADRLVNLAASLVRARCYEEAIPLAEEALALYRIAFGNTDPFIAGYLHDLAQMYVGARRYREAETYFLESIDIYYEQPEPFADYRTTFDLFNLSGLTQGRRTHNIMDSLNELSTLYREQGRYDEAENILQIMDSSTSRPETDSSAPVSYFPELTSDSSELASLYLSQGRYDEAETLLLQSLIDNLERFYSGPSGGYEILHENKNELNTSDLLLLIDMDISTQAIDHRITASIGQIAYLYHLQGRREEAEKFFEYAEKAADYFVENPELYLHTTREYTEKDVYNVFAAILNNLGIFRSSQGRYEDAEFFYVASLNLIYAAQFNTFTENILSTLEGISLSNQSFEFSISTARTLGNLADVYYSRGRNQEAEQIYQKLLDFYRREFGPNHPNVSVQFSKLSITAQKVGNIEQSRNLLEQALAAEEYNLGLNLAVLADAQRQAYIATIADSTRQSLSLHLQSAPTSPDAAELALTTVLRRKGRSLDAGTDSLQRLRQNLTLDDQATFNHLANARRELATLTFNPPPDLIPEQYRARLAELETEANQLEAALARRSAVFRAETGPVTLATIQTQIPANSVLVEYVRYQPFNANNFSNPWGAPRYAAYVLLPSGEVRGVDLGDAATIDGQIQRYLELLRCGERLATPCYKPEDLKPVAQDLYKVVLAPLQTHLEEVTHLLISPDSQLNLLPFAALVDEQNRYLIETYTLTHLTSGRDLLRLQHQAPSQQPPVVLADPDFDTADATGVMQVASASRGGARSADMANLRFGRLEGSAQEVAAIQPLLGNDAVVLTEARATENALKQVQGPNILHLATHGFFFEDESVSLTEIGNQAAIQVENPLLRSGLALAGFNQRESDGEDGVLTALEVAGLNLRGTRLVVLSACETGLGDIANGEGVYGLQRAFVIAGAESQMMSLWQVSDRRTADLMQQYYERLSQGEGRSESLRQVQLAALENPTYSHPYYWAAFFFSGQWTSMDHL
ncbi:MAG: CHAT domain-containing protein [Thainema sp.]